MRNYSLENLMFRASGVGHLGSALMSLEAAIRDLQLAGLEHEVGLLNNIGGQLSNVANSAVDSTSDFKISLLDDKEPKEATYDNDPKKDN